MVSGIEEKKDVEGRVRELAHALADAHAAMSIQQRQSESGRALFRAKSMAYGWLRDLETTELDRMFNRQPPPASLFRRIVNRLRQWICGNATNEGAAR